MSVDAQQPAMPECLPGMPATDLDVWADEVLADPYPTYRKLRDIGPVVWLTRYAMAAFPRFDEVRSSLARWQDYTSAEGVSSSSIANSALPPNTLHGLARLPVRAVRA